MNHRISGVNPFDFSLPRPDNPEALSPARSYSLDLVKWLALLTMLLDHLRFVWPQLSGLLVPGRLAFPLFCLAIAANVHRSQRGEVFTSTNQRYAVSLLVFALISELPHRLLVGVDSPTVNVLPSLLLGLMVAWGVHHRTFSSIALAIVALVVSIALQPWIMYGMPGVLLPATLLMVMGKPHTTWLIPATLFLLANISMDVLAAAITGELYPVILAGTLLGAPLIALWLEGTKVMFAIPSVGRWAYWFYPSHMLVLGVARWLYN